MKGIQKTGREKHVPFLYFLIGNLVLFDWRIIDPTEIIIEYPSVIETASDYVRPAVKVEISCLSMKEPFEVKEITTLISDAFPRADRDTSAVIPIVLPSRTFLEKAFLLCE